MPDPAATTMTPPTNNAVDTSGPVRPALSATTDMPQGDGGTPIPVTEPTPVPEPVATPTPTTATPEPPPEPGARFTRRISELVAERREAEASALAWKQQAEEAKALLNQAQETLRGIRPNSASTSSPTDPPQPTTEPRPVRESFADPNLYEEALIDWASRAASDRAAERMRAEVETQQRQRQEQEAQEQERQAQARLQEAQNRQLQELSQTWQGRRTKFIESHPDFPEIVETASLPLSIPMLSMIITREDGPELAYWLGKNPGEATRISQMIVPGQVFPAIDPNTGKTHPQAGMPIPDAVAQAFELGRIAVALGTSGAGTPPPNGGTPVAVTPPVTTSAPPPPTPITGASASATNKDPNDETMAEYAARREAEMNAQRQRHNSAGGGRVLQ